MLGPPKGHGGLFSKPRRIHGTGVRETQGQDGRGTSSVLPLDLINMALSRGGPPAALRQEVRRVRASNLSVLKRDPHAPVRK
jgi:hypothetical protein